MAAPINAPFLPPTIPPTPAPPAADPPITIAVLPHERSGSRRTSSSYTWRLGAGAALATVRRGGETRRGLLTGLTAAAAGAAAGRSAVVVLAGTNCPSRVWTNAGFWLNAFSGALAPTVYITTPE